MTDWTAFDRALASRRRDIVDGFVGFLRRNTVSQERDLVRQHAGWLAEEMRSRGLDAQVLDTSGNPAVYGERRIPGARRTVLIYCHFDTKPIPAAGWLQPSPLEPVLRRGLAEEASPIVPLDAVAPGDLGTHRLYARGASDDKGPIWSHLTALSLMDAVGTRPAVNVKFIFDGEEEIGSPFFGDLAERHRDRLQADLALITDGPKDATGRPVVAGGARGVLAIELTLEGARRDVHSGNFAVVNPAWRLNGLLASMATPDGEPLIEGLEADVIPPTAAERALMAAAPLDRGALERELGVRMPADLLERLMFRSTLNIRGLRSGFVGREANTIIPSSATVSIDVRMVKNQRWETVYRRIVDHIRAQGYTVIESDDAPIPDELRGRAVRVVERRGYDPAKTPLDTPLARALVDAVERAHGGERAVVLPTLGGSVPLWAFTDILALPTFVVPYASANNRQHSPNEHLKLDHLFQGARTTAGLLLDLAAMPA